MSQGESANLSVLGILLAYCILVGIKLGNRHFTRHKIRQSAFYSAFYFDPRARIMQFLPGTATTS